MQSRTDDESPLPAISSVIRRIKRPGICVACAAFAREVFSSLVLSLSLFHASRLMCVSCVSVGVEFVGRVLRLLLLLGVRL